MSSKAPTIATALATVFLAASSLTSPTALAQSNDTAQPSANRVTFDGRTVTRENAKFVSNEVLIQTDPGTDVVDLINNFIQDSPSEPRPTVRKLTANGTFFSLSYPTAGANTTGTVQQLMTEGDPAAAGLPSTRLLSSIASASGVRAASRNYIVRIAQSDDINSIIGVPDQPTSTPETPSSGKRAPVYPNDKNYRDLWHLKMNAPGYSDTTAPGASNFPLQWAYTPDASKVIIAVLDTGIVTNHPDIDYTRAVEPGFDFVSADLETSDDGTVGYDADPTDPPESALKVDCGGNGWHGSHVAGIAGAATTNNESGIAGGAWNVKVQSVRVLNKCGSGSLRDIVVGMYWSAGISLSGIPDNPNPAHIINMSLGVSTPGCPAIMGLALEEIAKKDILVVAAAGNEGSPVSNSAPANCNDVLSVAASDQRGHLTSYSNFGSIIDIMAPGGDTGRDDDGNGTNDGILSLVDKGYARYNGTSMAAPLVSAAAALLKAENPALTAPQIRRLLKENAIPRNAEH
ncbi:MAG: S8 family serine peptidase, partial [Pseudomonadota bacterium]